MPYFGRIPPSFEVFLKGAACNDFIDVYFLTDQSYEKALPPNVSIVQISLEEIRNAAEVALRTPIALSYAYKLCDLRPAFAMIFPEIVSKYGYWGWGDFDVAWGDLHGGLKTKLEAGYDVVTFNDLWLSGALTVFRNCQLLNSAFIRHDDWRQIFASDIHFAFDECMRRWQTYMEIGDLDLVDLDPPCFSKIVSMLGKSGELRCSFEKRIKEWISPTEVIEVDHVVGRILSLESAEEYALFHWVLRGSWVGFELPESEMPDRYYISRDGFWRHRYEIGRLRILLRRGKGQLRRLRKGASRRLSSLGSTAFGKWHKG